MKSMDIEKLLVWAFRDELPKGGATAWTPWDFLMRYHELGTIIDDQFGPLSTLPPIFGDPHPDALEIARVVRSRPRPAEALLVTHAIANTRPDWKPQPIRVLPIRDGSRVRIVGKNVGKHNGRSYYGEGSYCPLRYEPTLDEVQHARSEYSAWHAGLMDLVFILQLREHEATGPHVSAAPWLEPESKPRVLYAS
jgi:hypothetical protein